MERSVAWGTIAAGAASVGLAPLLTALVIPTEVMQWLVMMKWGITVPPEVAKWLCGLVGALLAGLGALAGLLTTHLVRDRYKAGEPQLAATAKERAAGVHVSSQGTTTTQEQP